MVRVLVFGKQSCAKCETTKKKLNHFLAKWEMTDRVGVEFHDLETPDGMSEGMYYDVDIVNLPSTIVMQGDRSVARWDGQVPDSNEVRLCLEGVEGAAQN